MFRRIVERFRSDSGFGLIETTVAMFMLAILAVLFLPLLIQGLKQSAANTTLATATQLVNEQLRIAHSKSPNCVEVAQRAGSIPFTDPRGVEIVITTIVDKAPEDCVPGPDTLTVTVSAVRTDTGDSIAEATTKVLVE